jgi:phosphatidylserine/phosphatidylglycerophosphate/cardiolipin synthase-like enzyme
MMPDPWYRCALFSVLIVLALPALARTADCPTLTVCFTPGGNCTQLIIQALHGAQRTVLVQAYSFTSAPIAKALLDAHKRGVKVQVILDKSQRTEKYHIPPDLVVTS